MTTTAILWLRNDLRLQDNPALAAASQCDHLLPVYIYDPEAAAPWQAGGARQWWLHHSLTRLRDSLRDRGSELYVRQGDSQAILQQLVGEYRITHVFWNRLYEQPLIQRDQAVKAWLQKQDIQVNTHNASLLIEPWNISTQQDKPYQVYSPYWKKADQSIQPEDSLMNTPGQLPKGLSNLNVGQIGALSLLSDIGWDAAFYDNWQPGEAGAHDHLQQFLNHRLHDYRTGRDRPADDLTSQLSPHLHHGEISPHRVYIRVAKWAAEHDQQGLVAGQETYHKELGWREFSYQLLYHFPQTTEEPLNKKFDNMQWREDAADLRAWQRGQTGIPIVDAGMRQLWNMGWMHNRVRMITASLLTKNLRIHWREGAKWFWDTLVDADLANNTMGWQWVAGTGADASPYFRIFNPVSQGEKFDPQGDYVRRWVPELAQLEKKFIHKPWEASQAVLADAGIELGTQYPHPIVDLKDSRQAALDAYQAIK